MDVGVIVADGNVVGWISKKVGVEVGIGDGVVVGTAACVPITSVFANDMAVSIALVEFISGDEAKWLQDVNNAIARNNKVLGLLMIFMIADQTLVERHPRAQCRRNVYHPSTIGTLCLGIVTFVLCTYSAILASIVQVIRDQHLFQTLLREYIASSKNIFLLAQSFHRNLRD